jgi:hypothetical protein
VQKQTPTKNPKVLPAPSVPDELLIPSHLASAFGAPALIHGETQAEFEALWAQFRATMKPREIVQELFVHEAVTCAWEVMRLRRLRNGVLAAGTERALIDMIEKLLLRSQDPKLARQNATGFVQRFLEGDQQGKTLVNKYLASQGLDMNAVMGLVMEKNLTTIERFNRMIDGASAQWMRILKEAGRYRDAIAALVETPRKLRMDGDPRLKRTPYDV